MRAVVDYDVAVHEEADEEAGEDEVHHRDHGDYDDGGHAGEADAVLHALVVAGGVGVTYERHDALGEAKGDVHGQHVYLLRDAHGGYGVGLVYRGEVVEYRHARDVQQILDCRRHADAADGAEKSGGTIGKLKGIFGDVEGGGKSLGDMAGDLTGKIGVDLPEGAKNALDAIAPLGGKFALITGAAAATAAAISKVEEALIGITTESAERATSISNIAETINMSVESTQLWDYVLKSVGSSIEEAQGDLSAFQEKIMEAAEGTGEAYEMFSKLGVAVQDENGALRETEPVLMDVIKALQLMGDETERNAISSTLLGGTGEKLIPLYNDNSQAIEHLMDRKRELGVLTGDEIENLKKVSEAMVDYEEKTNYAKDTLAKDFAPALSDFYEIAGDGLQNLAKTAERSTLVTFFGSILNLVGSLTPAFDLLGSALEVLAIPLGVISVALGAVADGMRIVLELGSALVNLLTLDFIGAAKNLDNIGAILSGSQSSAVNAWQGAFNASGTDNFPGGVTWVGENGPELLWLPQGSRIDNAQESRMYGGDTFYITINANKIKELNDLIRMANDARRMQRMGG